MGKPDEAFTTFRDDLISYLAQRLHVSEAAALSRLGDYLVDSDRHEDPPPWKTGGVRALPLAKKRDPNAL